jgi:hypothetical protein
MPCTLWLIVEDETDGEVVQALLKGRDVTVKPLAPTGGTGGLSRLRIQLRRLIQTAKQRRGSQDGCIAVLHDQDITDPRKQAEHKAINDICDAEQVVLVIACDEIEAWLLADNGLCEWLGMKPHNWDEQPKPSEELKRQIRNRYPRMRYPGRDRHKILEQVDGTGHQHSPSMQLAIRILESSPCTGSESS